MNLRIWSIASLAVTWALSLSCSSDDETHQPPPAGNTAGTTGQLPSDGGAPGNETGGATGQGTSGAPVDGTVGGEGGIGHLGLGGTVMVGGAPTYDDPLCDRQATWGDEAPLSNVSTPDADETLLAMTHDGRTIVFSRDDALLVADRASATATFGAPVAITLPEPYTHARGVALHDDGLAIVVGNVDGKALADVSRATRSGPFDGVPAPARYLAVSDNASKRSSAIASPVLAPDGSLFYTHIGASASSVFHAFLVEGGAFFDVPPTSEDVVALGGKDGDSKLTQSVSSDARTLFIFDEALGHTVGLWNSAPGAPFVQPVPFSELLSVFSVDGCSRLYATREVSGSLDVVILAPN